MPRGKSLTRPPTVVRPVDHAKIDQLIAALQAQTEAITALTVKLANPPAHVPPPQYGSTADDSRQAAEMMREATHKWMAERGDRFVPRGTKMDAAGAETIYAINLPPFELTQEQQDFLASLNPGTADPNATVGGPDPRTLTAEPVEDDEYGDPLDHQPPDDLLRDMAEELNAYYAAELNEIPPPPDNDALWRKRLSMFRLKLWQPDWGPTPGQAGCLVPQHLMNGRG